jgi:predicted phage terminase large subunit-like protein
VSTNTALSKMLQGIPAERARRRFRDFIPLAWPIAEPGRGFLPNWHIDLIADHLQAVAEGRIRRLLITMPPGHAKSLLVSVLWPAWLWVGDPRRRGLFTAYDGDLATRDSLRCRSVLASDWYQETFRPAWKFTGDQNEKDWFENDQKGFRMAFGVGGKGTGFRADYMVMDDPLNAKKQHSEPALREVIFWFDQVMSTRLNDPATGAIVIIMQRLSERDLAGHVLARGGYEHVNLPSEFEPERRSITSVGRDPRVRPGEILFPGLFPESVIAEAKSILGSQGYAAQHQQRPAPAEGSIFKRWWWRFWKPRHVDLPPVIYRDAEGGEHEAIVVTLPDYVEELIQSWDCSFKDLKGSDFVAGEVWGREGADAYLLDQVHERLGFPGTVAAVRAMSRKWPATMAKLIEDKANGPAVIQSLAHEIPGILAVQPLGGKVARAYAVSPLIEAGNVYLPHPAYAPWVHEFIEECATFPNGRNDDWVDAMTQALARLLARPLVSAPPPHDEDEPWDEDGPVWFPG